MDSKTNQTKTIISKVQKGLQALAQQNGATPKAPYSKLSCPNIKSVLKEAWKEYLGDLSVDESKNVAHSLLSLDSWVEMYIGTLILEKLKKHIEKDDILKIEALFSKGHLTGWAITDAVCGYVFRYWVTGSVENTKYICEWKNSDCLWLQRSSCVAFVNLAKHGDNAPNFKGFMKMLDETCEKTIKNPERFAQLGTGWLLRNIGTADKKQLTEFLERNMSYFSREGLSYAVEKLKPEERKFYMAERKKTPVDKLEEEVEEEAEPEEKNARKRRKNN